MHDLRHTAATLLLAQGVDVRTIMEVLGHSQISLTLDTYAHVMPALQADAARKMDAALGLIEGRSEALVGIGMGTRPMLTIRDGLQIVGLARELW